MKLNPANWIDFPALIKSIANWLYSLLFKDEIAKRDADEKATKAEVKGQLQLVKDAAGRIAEAEGHKQVIEQQVQIEQQKQAADVVKIQEVQRAKEAEDAGIDRQSDMDAFDSLHSGRHS